MAAQLGQDGLVVPLARADEELDGLAMDAGLHRDRLTGLALQPADQAAEDQGGVGPLLGAVAAGQGAPQERGESVLTALDLLGRHDGIGQEGLGIRVVQE
jgi:hypothetical protein